MRKFLPGSSSKKDEKKDVTSPTKSTTPAATTSPAKGTTTPAATAAPAPKPLIKTGSMPVKQAPATTKPPASSTSTTSLLTTSSGSAKEESPRSTAPSTPRSAASTPRATPASPLSASQETTQTLITSSDSAVQSSASSVSVTEGETTSTETVDQDGSTPRNTEEGGDASENAEPESPTTQGRGSSPGATVPPLQRREAAVFMGKGNKGSIPDAAKKGDKAKPQFSADKAPAEKKAPVQRKPLSPEFLARKKEDEECLNLIRDSFLKSNGEFDPEAFTRILNHMKKGTEMQKITKKGNVKKARLKLAIDGISIIVDHTRLGVDEIVEIRLGQTTDDFAKGGFSTLRPTKGKAFAIIHGKTRQISMSFTTESELDYLLYTHVLTKLMDTLKGDPIDATLKRAWTEVAKGKEKDLGHKEIPTVLNSLNIKVTPNWLKDKIKELKGNSEAKLTFNEVKQLIHFDLKERSELVPLFELYSQSGVMGINRVQLFFQKEQFQELSFDEASKLINKFSKKDKKDLGPGLNLTEFSALMESSENGLINPAHVPLFMDMSRPLSDYFISSSHNTYLTGDQLRSNSSVEMYVLTLKSGCRCVELDIWDGPNGEPIIFHGHTLTSKILFASAVKALRDYAFYSSPYPVLLSFENHCSIKQQQRMAEILKSVLGTKLLLPTPDGAPLPSPDAMKEKILIKGKTLSGILTGDAEDDEEMEAEEIIERASAISEQSNAGAAANPDLINPLAASSPAISALLAESESWESVSDGSNTSDNLSEGSSSSISSSSSLASLNEPPAETSPQPIPAPPPPPPIIKKDASPAQPRKDVGKQAAAAPKGAAGKTPALTKNAGAKNVAPSGTSSLPTPKGAVTKGAVAKGPATLTGAATPNVAAKHAGIRMAKELSDITYLRAKRFASFDAVKNDAPVCECSSFTEAKFGRMLRASTEFIELNRKRLSRTYPKGTRIDSSNYNPVPLWNVGVQLVALNYQTSSREMWINYGKFRINGGSGYVLKPPQLTTPAQATTPTKYTSATFTIISGRQLPTRGKTSIDPYVTVAIQGHQADNKELRSKTIKGNGYNPAWNQRLEFSLQASHLDHFLICVEDESNKEHIAHYSLPLESLREGYRIVPLYDRSERLINDSNLLIHVKFSRSIDWATKTVQEIRTAMQTAISRIEKHDLLKLLDLSEQLKKTMGSLQ